MQRLGALGALHRSAEGPQRRELRVRGAFAYLWATVGAGVEEIGVTEVLRYDLGSDAWRNAVRSTYCVHHRLPAYVEYWGCNSN